MQELKEMFLEIAIIFAKNFSDALLLSASQMHKLKEVNSQASIIESTSPKKYPNEIENPDFASLKVGDNVMISVIHRKKSERYGGVITAINGEKITVTNTVIKQTWEVAPHEVLYKFLNAYEIE
jgi:hypothetical protein